MERVVTVVNDDLPAVASNLQKSRKSWGQMSRILIREGADPKVSGHFFKAVVQVVLLFGAGTWVLTCKMDQALNRF